MQDQRRNLESVFGSQLGKDIPAEALFRSNLISINENKRAKRLTHNLVQKQPENFKHENENSEAPSTGEEMKEEESNSAAAEERLESL